MRRRRSRVLRAIVLAGLAGCQRHGQTTDGEASAAPEISVATAVAARQPFTEYQTAIGIVTARPGHVASLAPPAPTRVAHVFVAAGQRVAAGTPLVEFDRAPFESQARSAHAAVTSAEHAFERAERLVAAGILARKDVDQANADLAQARATAVAANRALALATLRAPIPGVVTRVGAVLGASVDPSQPVVEVADLSAVDLIFTIAPSAATRIRSGAAARVSAGQSAAGEQLGTATVAEVGATVDTASRGVLVRARMTNPSRPPRIGETVFGQITVAVHPDAVTVPVAALVPRGDGLVVFVVDSTHRAHATPVAVGGRTEQVAEITRGLTGGETIVTVGAYGVEDSSLVAPGSGR